jgi:hypothetical protein
MGAQALAPVLLGKAPGVRAADGLYA